MGHPLNIVMCEPLTWDSTTKVGSHHYAEQLAAMGHRVFWISHDIHLPSLLRNPGSSPSREVQRVGIHHDILSWHPLVPLPFRNKPLLDTPLVAKLNRPFCRSTIRRVLKEHNFETIDILWLSQGYSSYLALDTLNATTTFFRMSDNARAFREFPKTYAILERELMKRADVIGITSPALRDTIPASNQSRVIDCPNGCHWSLFQNTRPPSTDSRRVIFTGTLGSWFDTGFLTEVARRCPDYLFDIHGPLEATCASLADEPNITLHGRFDYSALPGILANADIGIIPFKTNDGVGEFANPLKAWEYLAAGLPVVTTPLPALTSVPGAIYTADTPETFANHIKSCSISRDVDIARRELAHAYDWGSLTEKLLARLS